MGGVSSVWFVFVGGVVVGGRDWVRNREETMSDARKEAWDQFYALWQTDAHASDLFNIAWYAAFHEGYSAGESDVWER